MERRRRIWALALALAFAAGAVIGSRGGDDGNAAKPARAPAQRVADAPVHKAPPRTPPIHWRASRSLGTPTAGRLVRAVHLPAAGADFVTWHPVADRRPNAPWRRWGSRRLVRTLLAVLHEHRRAHPEAPRLVVGDLSLRRGGPFPPDDEEEGTHASHQNGLDVDVYLPRRDRLLRPPLRRAQVDRALAQDLVDRFVAAGAQRIFVSRRLRLRGPRAVVQHWPRHGDHLHVRLKARARGSGAAR
jgi:murein endopeptidase